MNHQTNVSRELDRTRGCIFATGLLMFVSDLVYLQIIYARVLPAEIRHTFTVHAFVIFGVFVALSLLARWWPLLAGVLALGWFWGVHVYYAPHLAGAVFEGMYTKASLTVVLLCGIASALRARRLQRSW